jgi:16S rRNA (adenine1518-N6/adenine1519-N6)-dimethyltransferase
MAAEERRNVLDLARGAFQLRRKTLRHGMTRALGDAGLAAAVLVRCGIDAGRRPETLGLEEWRDLARAAEALR